MGILTIIYILVFLVFALVAFAAMQIKLAGMQIKDFWGFIEANQMLDKLYHFAKQYQNMSPQEQVIYLAEAEKIFLAFDKVPNKYIPLSTLCMGTIIAILINLQAGINAEVILGGMISGLASTGLYETLRNLFNKDGKKNEGEWSLSFLKGEL